MSSVTCPDMITTTGEDDGAEAPPTTPPALRTQNYFAVPRRGQLAGRAYITTPTHVRSPLAQTPSPVPSDDNPLSPALTYIPTNATRLKEEFTNGASPTNDDSQPDEFVLPPSPDVPLDSAQPEAGPSTSDAAEPDPISWSDFLERYSEGKWDPSRPPPKPDSSFHSSGVLSRRKSLSVPEMPDTTHLPRRPSISHKNISDLGIRTPAPPRLASAGRTQSSPEHVTSDPPTLVQRRGAEKLFLEAFSPPTFSGSSSLKAMSIHAKTPSPPIGPPILAHPITPSAVADAATVRWAGARVKVAPLALSSPERTSLCF